MDLVDEDDGLRSAGLPVFARFLHQCADVLDGTAGGREGDEFRLRLVGDDAGHGGLAGAGRPPEDHRRDAVALDGGAEKASLAKELIEADDLFQGARPDALGEGSVRPRRRLEGGVVEEGSGHSQQSSEKSMLPPLTTIAVFPFALIMPDSSAAIPSAPVGSITSLVRYMASFTVS